MSSVNFGDARKIILETLIGLRNGEISASTGLAVAANMKVLNDSLQVEINAAKMSIAAAAIGKDFGEITRLGTRPMFDGELIESTAVTQKAIKVVKGRRQLK